MNNYKQQIVQSDVYFDEFDYKTTSTAKTQTAVLENDSEAVKFNAKIPENFDKIIHYDTYAKPQQVKDVHRVYVEHTTGINQDLRPTSTTMQFQGLNKAEIYKDVRENSTATYETSTKTSKQSKILIAFMSVAIVLLSFLIVFNTILLKNLNQTIMNKQAEVQELLTQNEVANDRLNEVSSDQAIIDAAKELGMN
ncbi:MAG: hypothetical protein IJW26_00605 [Clostridia bacterium]|nr:hypothetical protein [Clostridia bacterium]